MNLIYNISEASGITQREMVPHSRDGRLLIILQGKSQLRIFRLDDSFGGSEDRARISLATLATTVQKLLGRGAVKDKVISVANGLKSE